MTISYELQAGVTREIYGMPAFVSLIVPDVPATAAWFTRALDFVELFAMPPGDDPVLIHLRRWRYQDILIRRAAAGGHQSPSAIPADVQVSFAAEYDELDALAERARSSGALEVHGPLDTKWHTRDLGAACARVISRPRNGQRPAGKRVPER